MDTNQYTHWYVRRARAWSLIRRGRVELVAVARGSEVVAVRFGRYLKMDGNGNELREVRTLHVFF